MPIGMASPSLACMADLDFPTCVIHACWPLQPSSTPLLLHPSSLYFLPLLSVDTKGHPALAGPQGFLPCPMLTCKLGQSVFWAFSCSNFRSTPACEPCLRTQSQLWLYLVLLSELLLDKSTTREKARNVDALNKFLRTAASFP